MVELIKTGKNFTIDLQLQNDSKFLTMLWIPPGEFVMGKNHIDFEKAKSEGNDLLVKEIPAKISKGFWISQFQVTCEQCQSIGIRMGKWCKGGNFPFLIIDWLDAIHFCRELNIRYKNLLPPGYHFSLPTELQWEYAAKSGKEDDDQPLSYEEYKRRYYGVDAIEVGQNRAPNAWGLFDMLENGTEYCYDIAAFPFSPPWDEEEKSIYKIEDGRVVDWLSNKYPDSFAFFMDDYYTYRVAKGVYSSTQRFGIPPKLYNLAFRLSLRPIIEGPNCDLDDPWLKAERINIMGD